jgi:16S rRNA processing protein RimM
MSAPEVPGRDQERALDKGSRHKRRPKAEMISRPAVPIPRAEAPDLAGGGDGFVTLAAISGAHGVQGEVRLKLFTDHAENLRAYASFEVSGGRLTLTSIRSGTNGAVARFAEIGDRTSAETYRGTALRVPRSALPSLQDGEYYHADLVGVPCVSEAGEPLGLVAAVENFGAGDVIEIRRPDGKLFMVPITAVAEVPASPLVVDTAFIAV